MSDEALLRRLLREHAEAVSTEIAIIKEDAILRLFDAVQNEYAAQVARLTAELATANEDAALPDYNPNGTANPKGDAAYWRTRAEAAETRLADRDAEVARLTELQRAASEFIGYIKAGNNAKAHLQMLFLEVLINEESKNGAKK